MKNFIYGAMLFSGIALAAFSSCKKSDITTAPVTAVSTIKGDPALTIFSAIESRSGDDNLVNTSASLLVPVDSAFISAGITVANVASLSIADCDSIVKYYTFPTAVSFSGNGNTETAFSSDLGPALFADSTSSTLYFNGTAAATTTPTVIGTTAIYKLTQFINPPVASVAQVAAADTSLSLFYEAFNRTGLATNLSSGSFTLFAPTNAAFINAGYPDIASIDAADINTLTQLLMYHAVASDYFDNDLASKTSLTTLQGGALQISETAGLQLIGNSDPSAPANLLNNGIIAGNVLVYKINNLLLP